MYAGDEFRKIFTDGLFTSVHGSHISESQFYPNLCHVCFSHNRETPLKICGGCRMISYCGKDHQKRHWPKHKTLCLPISNLLKATGESNIFDAVSSVDSKSKSLDTEQSLVYQHITNACNDRKIYPYEFQMIHFNRSCEVCEETDTTLLKSCENCPQANFCADHEGHPNHVQYCDLYTICCFLDALEVSFGKLGLEDMCTICVPKISRLPRSMEEFMNIPPGISCQDLSYWLSKSLSQYVTKVLTLLYALEKINFSENQELIVYVIDKNTELMSYYELILNFLPRVEKIRIIFTSLVARPSEEYTCQKVPSLAVQRIIFEVREFCFDKDHADNNISIQPTIVVGYDLSVEFLKECSGLILALKNFKCPFLLTSSCENEARDIHERMKGIFGSENDFYVERNPFSSLRPVRCANGFERISHQNAYNIIFYQNSYSEDDSDSTLEMNYDLHQESSSTASTIDNDDYDKLVSDHRELLEENRHYKEKYILMMKKNESLTSTFEEIKEECLSGIEKLTKAIHKLQVKVKQDLDDCS
ncbi:uncharacterized protein LOC117167664 [Belonocnema kinseyi]|uniref:uncharacterized protein LOC117167664 n=1 Tax=Belonocnema kinseyi TaxID=2817044 RepID=UPI00143D3553|nr:uncharacterized protein LOC117167664 [Belonocnema kinseyi]